MLVNLEPCKKWHLICRIKRKRASALVAPISISVLGGITTRLRRRVHEVHARICLPDARLMVRLGIDVGVGRRARAFESVVCGAREFFSVNFVGVLWCCTSVSCGHAKWKRNKHRGRDLVPPQAGERVR